MYTSIFVITENSVTIYHVSHVICEQYWCITYILTLVFQACNFCNLIIQAVGDAFTELLRNLHNKFCQREREGRWGNMCTKE